MEFELYFDNIPTGILVADNKGKIIYTNRHLEKMFGLDSENLTNKPVNELIPERYRDKHLKYIKNYFQKPESRPMGTGRDLYAKKNDGTEFPVEIGLAPIKLFKKSYIIATVIDLTYRKKAERLIRESENKLQAILDNSPDAILVYNTEGEIIKFNNEGKKLIHGKDNKNIANIFDTIPLEHKNLFRINLDKAKKGKKVMDWETDRIFIGDKILPSSISLVYVKENGGLFIETVRDLTESINLRNKILEYEKAQIVAKMAEGVAHHMGTPITSILLRIQMLKEDICNPDEIDDIEAKLESIEKHILHCKDVMQRLLRFSANTKGEKAKIELTNVIRNSIDTIIPLCEKMGIGTDFEPKNKLYIYADKNLIELVLTDIMMNSIDAMKSGGELVVELIKNRKSVDIDIKDTGEGISIEVLPHIFEPFYTTKASGKGTGLGLAVAKRIVQDHNGKITIRSIENKGTTVKINLPLSD